MVGDSVSANNVAVQTVCHKLDPGGKKLKPKCYNFILNMYDFIFTFYNHFLNNMP